MKSPIKILSFIFLVTLLTACGGKEGDPLTPEERKDKTPPVITLAGADPFVLKKDEKYKEPGASANDDVNGKVAVAISGVVNTKKIGTYTVTYSARDRAGNKASKKRTVRVTPKVIDYEKPVITLVGKDPIEVEQGTTFKDPGAVAKDNIDGKIKVTVSGRVDTERLGTYTLTYTARDSSGNLTTKIRHVVVVPASVIHNVNNVNELRTALENAANNGSNDVIILQKGVYKTTSDGLKTFKYNDTEGFNLTIQAANGLKRGDVVLDGGETDLVLQYANTFSNSANDVRTLRLERLVIRNGKNTETSYGGGINVNHNLELIDCEVSANRTTQGKGAGIYASKDAYIEKSLIDNNISLSNYYHNGGGLYVDYNAVILNSIISNNESYSGGGVFAGSIYLKNSLVTKNRTSQYGGGVYSNHLSCENSVISNNSSDNSGSAAIYSYNTTVLNHCRITGNSNIKGTGASYSVVYAPASLIVGSIFENNNGYLLGTGSYWNTVLVNNTFINNKNDGIAYIRGRFINNLFDAGVDLYSDSTIYNNYIDYLTLKENNHVVVKKNNVQPSQGALSLTNELVPKAGSVLINKGLNFANPTFKSLFAVGEKFRSSDDETMYDRIVKMLQKDYQGKNRIVGGTIDIGANEKQ